LDRSPHPASLQVRDLQILAGGPGRSVRMTMSAALVQAKQEDRKVLVFFAETPPSTTARNMSTTTPQKNAKHITRGKFIKVLIQVAKTDDPAKRYNVKNFPTFLLLDAQGKVLNRRVGFVGEAAFQNGFLDCSEVKGL